MKWSLRDPVVLFLCFFVGSLIVLMWNSPFYHTPADKALNVIKGLGIGVAVLGAAYLWSTNRGRKLRGELDNSEDSEDVSLLDEHPGLFQSSEITPEIHVHPDAERYREFLKKRANEDQNESISQKKKKSERRRRMVR